jgi:TPR repeat protein
LTHNKNDNPQCSDLLFQIATTLVFYNEDPALGLHIFQRLANQGHVDAMVACGVILVEGLGVPPDEVQGVAWLEKAVQLDSPQAYYELGTAYYTGIADVLEEDSRAAFSLFAKAAAVGHVASIYMMADCLATGEGVDQNVAESVPLFYQAAEQGHRFARQRIRELLANPEYQEVNG